MNYFFIGIKGSGMSALALVLKGMGHNVEGSDVDTHYFTETKLLENNIKILDFGQKDFSKFKGIVILGNAFNEEHIDYKNAKENNLDIISYSKALNNIVISTNSIAISGTNGKTTTTGLTKEVLKDFNTSYLIGDGTGVGKVNSDYFVFEACEYKLTFLNYTPKYGVINNIEFDHPDYFKDVNHVIESFQKFANNLETLIINGDDENCQKITHPNKLSFGLKPTNDLIATNVNYQKEGIKLKLTHLGEDLGEFLLPFYGEHMLYNSLASISLGLVLKMNIQTIIDNLIQFQGVSRRFNEEVINKEQNITLIDDYAHHGTAIELTIKAIRQKYEKEKLTVLFQPHTFSRTEAFKEEFAKSLVLADNIILVDIFGSAREEESNITNDAIVEEIHKLNSQDKIINFEQIDNDKENQVICLLGAGDIDLLFKEKIKDLFNKE